MKKTPLDAARLIQEVIANIGWDADPLEIAENVQRLDIGLPAEDEFLVLCNWLGKCQLLHKLEQQQIPLSSKKEFQVPDILAKFKTQTNDTPVLIEVKTSDHHTLAFTKDYYKKINKYADLLAFPLLIAWKRFNLWVLFDINEMNKVGKSYKIDFGHALKNSLMSSLAGDFAYTVSPEVKIHLDFKKERLVKADNTRQSEEWITIVDNAYMTNSLGERGVDFDTDVQALIMTWDLEEEELITDTHIRYSLKAKQVISFAQNALTRLLEWENKQNYKPHWRSLLRESNITKSCSNFEVSVDKALNAKVVNLILHVRPQNTRSYISSSNKKIK